MFSYLAYAEADDVSGTGLTVVVITALLVVFFGVMALIPWRTARARWGRASQAMSALMVLWTVLAIGITSCTILSQMNWAQQHQTNMLNGADPRDISDKPSLFWFWLSWSALAAIYTALMCWALARPRNMRA